MVQEIGPFYCTVHDRDDREVHDDSSEPNREQMRQHIDVLAHIRENRNYLRMNIYFYKYRMKLEEPLQSN
jgi:hypothetical protein